MKQYFQHLWTNSNYRTAIFIALACTLWLASGQLNSKSVGSETAKPVSDLTRVKARTQQAQIYSPSVPVRARTEANRRISLQAEVAGKVIKLPVAEGEMVQRGETVCELAVQDRKLRYVEAKSAVDQAQLEYTGSLRLKSSGYQSDTADLLNEIIDEFELLYPNIEIQAMNRGFINEIPRGARLSSKSWF